MFKRLVLACIVVVASVGLGSAEGAPSATADYIVVLKAGVDPAAVVRDHEKRFGVQVQFVYNYALRGYAATIDSSAVPGISADSRVLFVQRPEATVTVPSERRPPHASPQVPQPEQRLSIGLDRVDAEQSSTQAGDGHGTVNLNVAVLDTGIDTKHPDLNVAGGVNCLPGESKADIFDRDGHGTGVAGFIGALDNQIGRVGVAPGVKLFGLRVLDSTGEGSDAMVLCGIDWVASTRTNANKNDDIAVANMSLGGPGSDDGHCGLSDHHALHLAICNTTGLGVTFVVAAMNDATDLATFEPASYDEVLTATAMADYDGQPAGLASPTCAPFGDDDSAANFSNFATLLGDQAHMLAAPGTCLGSTFPGSTYAVFFGGTSFASPTIAGSVALCIASGPCAGKTPAQIISKFVADAAAYNTANTAYGFQGDPLRPITGKYYGYLHRAGQY